MNPCLNNIVSIHNPCSGNQVTSLSGYDLLDAPELSYKEVANFQKEAKNTYDFLVSKRKLAILDVQNDLMSVLAFNNNLVNLTSIDYDSSEYSNTPVGTSSNERGFVLYRVESNSKTLKSLLISELYVNSANDVDGLEIKIYDGNRLIKIRKDVKAGLNLISLPDTIIFTSPVVRFIISDERFNPLQTKLICMTGCSGSKNPCAHTKGFDSKQNDTKNGYGLGIKFRCECDYSKLLCDMSKTFTGKLIFLKTRLILIDERLHSDRLNNVVVYDHDRLKELKQELLNDYNYTFNAMKDSIANVVKGYCGECIKCTGVSYKTNN